MKSTHRLGLVFAGATFTLALGSGCGTTVVTDSNRGAGGSAATTTGSSSSGSAGGGGGSQTSTTTSGGGAAGGSTTSSSGGGAGGAPTGTSFAAALPIAIDAPSGLTKGTLPDPSATQVFYAFTGKKGEPIEVTTIAKPAPGLGDPFDPTFLNLFVTVFDDTHATLAQDDDPWPRVTKDPTLFTLLPADGVYYLMVEDCNVEFPGSCADPSAIVHKDYEVGVFSVPKLASPHPAPEGAEPNDTEATAGPLEFVIPAGASTYGLSLVYGSLESGTDKDTFKLTIPMDAQVPPGARLRANFWIQPSGFINGGDGSTTSPGRIYVIDANDLTGNHLSEIDDTNYGKGDDPISGPAAVSVPVASGGAYYFVVEHSSMAADSNDFYFALASVGGAPLWLPYPNAPAKEAADASNDVMATPEVLQAIDDLNGAFDFDVDGVMGKKGADVDYYEIDVPAGVASITSTCVAQRAGSGVRGLTFGLYEGNGTAIPGTSQTENQDQDPVYFGPNNGGYPLPPGATTILLKVEAASQDATVTDNSYVCQTRVF